MKKVFQFVCPIHSLIAIDFVTISDRKPSDLLSFRVVLSILQLANFVACSGWQGSRGEKELRSSWWTWLSHRASYQLVWHVRVSYGRWIAFQSAGMWAMLVTLYRRLATVWSSNFEMALGEKRKYGHHFGHFYLGFLIIVFINKPHEPCKSGLHVDQCAL